MSIVDLTLAPRGIAMALVSNTGLFPSPLTALAQRVDRGGLHWEITYTYKDITEAARADLIGTLAALRGQANSLRVPTYDNPRQGAYGGTPLVDGAAQTGSTIDIKGASISVTDWIKKGDYFSVIVNGEPELKVCTADASSDGAGDITALAFQPRLRAAPADSAAIYVSDGVLTEPSGIFILNEQAAKWSSEHWISGARSSLSIAMIEDLFATQV